MLLLVVYIAFSLLIASTFSLLEAVLLSARSAALLERKNAGSRGAGLLLELKRTRIDEALTAILTLNTAANTFGAAMAGAVASEAYGLSEGIFATILTFLVLVFAEIIPKTIGANYAIAFSGITGWTLHGLVRFMRPLLVVTGGLTRRLTRSGRPPMSREELAAYIAIATREGTIEGTEQKVMANLLRFQEIYISDVMTPRTVVEMLPARTTIEEFLSNRRAKVFSRIPLYRKTFDEVDGYLLVRDLLLDVAEGTDRSQPISRYKRKIGFVPELASIADALQQFLRRREHVAVAIDEYGGVSGLVTLEDILETILGVEIVDEADRVADLRRVAAGLRDRRLVRIRELHQLSPENHDDWNGRR